MLADQTEVLVIGAGAGGAAASWRLASLGHEVTCLDLGGWTDPERSPSRRADWEVVRQRAWNPNPNLRRGPWDDPVDDTDSEIKPLLWNGIGGSTALWSCHFPRMHPSDFRTRSLDGVGDDWPLSYADLAPYYDLNERMMGWPAFRDIPPTPCPTRPACRRWGSTPARAGWPKR